MGAWNPSLISGILASKRWFANAIHAVVSRVSRKLTRVGKRLQFVDSDLSLRGRTRIATQRKVGRSHLPHVAGFVDSFSFLIAAGVFEAHLFVTDQAQEQIALGCAFAVWSFQGGQHAK